LKWRVDGYWWENTSWFDAIEYLHQSDFQ